MCTSCNQNAELARQQAQMNHRVHAINHQHAVKAQGVQIPSTLGTNQQLAIQAYQQRVQQELQRKSGIRSPQKRYR